MQVEKGSFHQKLAKVIDIWRALRFWVVMFLGITPMLAGAHVVSHLIGDVELQEERIVMEIAFDSGLAIPENRQDPDIPAPTLDWLRALSSEASLALWKEAERFTADRLRLYWKVEEGELVPLPVLWSDVTDLSTRRALTETGGAMIPLRVSVPIPDGKGEVFVEWLDGVEDIVEPALYLRVSEIDSDDTLVFPIAVGAMQFLGTYDASLDGERAVETRDATAWRWFIEGLVHVVPAGLDHILFIVGLFLAGGGWRFLTVQSLMFTLAHTVTLGLASWGVVGVSSTVVEPLIALSICWVGVENLLRRENAVQSRSRLVAVFLFGLVHGLGFAGVMQTLVPEGGLSWGAVIPFNLGVEAGQIVVLLAAGALYLGLRRWREEAIPLASKAGSCAIVLVGALWFVQRLAG